MVIEKSCATCGGSGQIGFFQGESRFLLTWEECPRCGGTGLAGPTEDDPGRAARMPRQGRKRGKKKGR